MPPNSARAGKLNFKLIEDTRPGEAKRWVVVAPPGVPECSLLLAKAANDEQKASVGNQAGGRAFLFLFTDDFWRDYEKMQKNGVKFIRPPKEEGYGAVAVFEDLYGNRRDLLQPSEQNQTAKF